MVVAPSSLAGLSYTSFEYSNTTAPKVPVSASGVATISTTVTNTGGIAGEEVAQLYLRDMIAPVTTPVMMLKGFERCARQHIIHAVLGLCGAVPAH